VTQLRISGLTASVDGHEILRGIDLEVESGRVDVIMGPNGSGKSTLANVIMGHPAYEVTGGDITLDGESLVGTATHERASRGLFHAMQYPTEVAGVRLAPMLAEAFAAGHLVGGVPHDDVGRRIEALTQDENLGVLAITHYARLLDELQPDRIHVLLGGRIVKSGGPELARELEETGYEGIAEEFGIQLADDEPGAAGREAGKGVAMDVEGPMTESALDF